MIDLIYSGSTSEDLGDWTDLLSLDESIPDYLRRELLDKGGCLIDGRLF